MIPLGSVSVLSKFYVLAPIRWEVAGVETSWTGFASKIAVIPSGTAPVSGDFKTATTETSGADRMARLLVGPGTATVLTPGDWDVYSQVLETTENPVLFHGSFRTF
jgi:hypothetical protein